MTEVRHPASGERIHFTQNAFESFRHTVTAGFGARTLRAALAQFKQQPLIKFALLTLHTHELTKLLLASIDSALRGGPPVAHYYGLG